MMTNIIIHINPDRISTTANGRIRYRLLPPWRPYWSPWEKYDSELFKTNFYCFKSSFLSL